MLRRGRFLRGLLFGLGLVGCRAEPLFVPLDGLVDDRWLVVVTTDSDGTAAKVSGAFDLRRPAEAVLQAGPEQNLLLVSFSDEALPFAPLGDLRATMAAAPSAPKYGVGPTALTARLAWPAEARTRSFGAEGELEDVSDPKSRAEVSLDFEYEGEPAISFRPFANTEAYLEALEPFALAEGSTVGDYQLIKDLIVVDERRIVALLPMILIVFERDQTEMPSSFVAGRPQRWFPVSRAIGGPGGAFIDLDLDDEPAADGRRRLFVSGADAPGSGRVWSFLLDDEGLELESTIEIRGSGPWPELQEITVDSEGTVLVAAENRFMAVKTRTATVFQSTRSLEQFVFATKASVDEPPELTMLGDKHPGPRPHLVGFSNGWLVEGDAVTGNWTLAGELQRALGRTSRPHVLSALAREDGELWATSRHGGLFRRRPGANFEALMVRASPALAACATPDQVIEQHIRGLWLHEDHAFAFGEDCTAVVRVRLEDAHVSAVLQEGTTEAEGQGGRLRHRGGRGGAGIYVFAGYGGYVGVVDAP